MGYMTRCPRCKLQDRLSLDAFGPGNSRGDPPGCVEDSDQLKAVDDSDQLKVVEGRIDEPVDTDVAGAEESGTTAQELVWHISLESYKTLPTTVNALGKRMDAMDKRMDGLEEKMGALDKTVESMRLDLDGVHHKLDGIQKSLDKLSLSKPPTPEIQFTSVASELSLDDSSMGADPSPNPNALQLPESTASLDNQRSTSNQRSARSLKSIFKDLDHKAKKISRQRLYGSGCDICDASCG